MQTHPLCPFHVIPSPPTTNACKDMVLCINQSPGLSCWYPLPILKFCFLFFKRENPFYLHLEKVSFSFSSPPPQLLLETLQFAKKSTSLQEWGLEKITIHQEHRWLIQNLIGINALFSPSFTPDIDNVLSLPSSPLDNMLSLSSQVPDKILLSLGAYPDKTLFSFIFIPIEG